MAKGGSWRGNFQKNICPECGKEVEILNNDVQFSMDLHFQSHKSLETITREIDMRLREAQVGKSNRFKGESTYSCPQCYEYIEVINNDVRLSLELHSQKHNKLETRTDDQLSTSSGQSKNSGKQFKIKKDISTGNPNPPPDSPSILGALFNVMPPGLKSHQGFVVENDKGNAFCNICQLVVEPLFSITEHLKTKLHEDTVILFLKKSLPDDLHSIMEYVSFYGSNLCCNLCRCKIDLCSTNVHETIVSIMVHNLGKAHLNKNARGDCNNYQQDDSTAKLMIKALASVSPVVADNMHFLDYKMQPQYKCNLCEKLIVYDKNENTMLKNFISHFNSAGHIKCIQTTAMLRSFQASSYQGKGKHDFIVSKSNIRCTTCDCNIEASIEQLNLHVNEKVAILDKDKEPKNEPTKINIKSLLNTLSPPFKNVGYIVANNQGQTTCLLCNCTIPATKYNLETHLTGGKHKTSLGKELDKNNAQTPNSNNPIPVLPQNTQATTSFDLVYNFLTNSDLLIGQNRKYLVKYSDGKHYICTLCGALIQATTDMDLFKRNIYSHIQSSGHSYCLGIQNQMDQVLSKELINPKVTEFFTTIPPSFSKDIGFIKAPVNGIDFLFCIVCNLKIPPHSKCLQEHLEGVNHETYVQRYNKVHQDLKNHQSTVDGDILLTNLIKADSTIKSGSKFLILDGEHYICKLCQSKIVRSFDELVLKENLHSHLKGQKHKKSLDKLIEDMLNKVTLSDPVIRTDRNLLKQKDGLLLCTPCNCTLSSAAEEDTFRNNLSIHLKGKNHLNNKAKLNQKPKTVPTAPVSVPVAADLTSNSLIEKLFQFLPANFQDDVIYIKNSSIEGYLSCTLCKNIINPRYLREHLEEEKHIQEKRSNGYKF